jgi:2'-5' RNA ligase
VPAAVRLFVAVPCGEPLRAALTSRRDAFAGAPGLRWTAPDTWHLTLQFLGDWPRQRIPALVEALAKGVEPPPFVLSPRGLGAFPDLGRPRVLFLQLGDDGAAAALARSVREKVAEIWPDGPQDTKPFRPHLTLARLRRPLAPESLKALSEWDLSGLPELPVEGFRLYSSVLDRGGARHGVEAEFALRKKGEK